MKPLEIPACPHCGSILEKTPQRKTKCPHCGKDIHVRTDPFKHEKILVSHEDSVAIDFLNLQREGAGSQIDFTMRISKVEYQEVENELAASFKSKPSIMDILWSILGKHEMKAANKSDYQKLSWLYVSQASLLQQIGKPFRHLLKVSLKYQLELAKSLGSEYKNVKLLAGLCLPNVCNRCTNINYKIFNIDDALTDIPMPPEDCDRPYCFIFQPLRGKTS